MAKIVKLSRQMADLIAAGEVVERPASVVKELVENAVDAGADAITVEIRNGGISYIRVTDNGCGIAREDVKTAFLSHATSKIRTAEDLSGIMTLGFRGEALPSIAAVASVNMITKTANEQMGTSLMIEGGSVTDFSDAGCAVGTTVIVRKLFYNTPARMKFLKKDVSEGNFVSAVVEKEALAHAEISFRFIRDGKQVFTTNGDSNLRGVCFSAFGGDFSSGLIDVGCKTGNIEVSGLITPPYNCRGSRGMQYFFVNRRCVKSASVTAAFENAYKNSVMTGKFPGGVLFISMPPELVDVNVHPAKTEVRFSDERAVFDAVYHAVKSALNEDNSLKQAAFTVKKPAVSPDSFKVRENSFEQTTLKENEAYIKDVLEPLSRAVAFSDITSDYEPQTDEPIKIEFPVSETLKTPFVNEKKDEESKPLPFENGDNSFRLLGEAYKTYILIEYRGKLCVIDKHAAHERILFNKLKNRDNNCAGQILALPVTVSLGKEEYTALIENLDLINKAGFDAEDFGNGSVIVRSCPADLDHCEISPLISELAQRLLNFRRDIENERLEWIYHNVACRGAVKAGDTNTERELYELVKAVLSDSEVRFCPHGRPVMIEISEHELEKQFGRV